MIWGKFDTFNLKVLRVKRKIFPDMTSIYNLGIRNHSMDGYKNLQKWTSIRTANIVSLHTVFTIKAFGDQSIMFVYDFHPAAETLMQRHFMQGFYNKKRQQRKT